MVHFRAAVVAIVIVLANGCILFFFSERLFWAVPRPGDNLIDLAIGLLAYSLAGYLFLALAYWLRIGTWHGLILLGAIFGWLIEGVWASTLYGTEPSAPFPLSILVTAVNWHSLISVVFGWWLVPKALRHERSIWAVSAAVGLGLFWGAWAIFERFESPPIVPSIFEFAGHAFVSTGSLMLSYWLMARLSVWEFRPSLAGVALVVALHIAWFAFLNLATLGLGWFAIALLTLLLTATCAILRLARSSTGGTILADAYRGGVSPLRYMLLLLAPLTATASYALSLVSGGAVPPLHQFIFIGSIVAAAGATGAALYFTLRDIIRKQRAPA